MAGLIGNNPNATVSGVSGAGAGSLLVWGLSRLGVSIDPVAAAAIAGGVSTVALWIGRDGLKGIVRRIWSGSPPPAPPAPPAAPEVTP